VSAEVGGEEDKADLIDFLQMGYTLCVLGVWMCVSLESNKLMLLHPGCGTMGIAITSGVITSLGSAQPPSDAQGGAILNLPSNIDRSIPSYFLVTCARDPTARKLGNLFQCLGRLGESVEIIQNGNVEAVKRADVILLWYAYLFETRRRTGLCSIAVSPIRHMRS